MLLARLDGRLAEELGLSGAEDAGTPNDNRDTRPVAGLPSSDLSSSFEDAVVLYLELRRLPLTVTEAGT